MRGATLYLVLALLSSPDTNIAASFNVSGPDTHTLHRNGSVSVTCRHDSESAKEMDAKLINEKMETVCEVQKEGCSVTWAGRNVTFTLWNLQAGDEDKLYNCRFHQFDSIPIISRNGKSTKLFPGSKIPFPPPQDTPCDSAPSEEHPEPRPLSRDPLVWVLTAGAACLGLYGFIVTILFLKLKQQQVQSQGQFGQCVFQEM